jgi:hypothetical protein
MTRKMTTKKEQENDQKNGQESGQENRSRNQPPKAAGNGAPCELRTRVNRRSDQDRRPERTKGVEGPLSLPWVPWPVRRGGWLIYGSAIRIPAKS